MIQVSILEKNDQIQPTDWCRPLSIGSMSGGHSDYYSFKCMYTGTPENNAKWVRASAVIGEIWFGHTVAEFSKIGLKYEFVRGDVPRSHRLCMTGYSDLSKSKPKRQVEDDYDDIPF